MAATVRSPTPGPSNLNQKSISGDLITFGDKCPQNGSKNVHPRPPDSPTKGLLWIEQGAAPLHESTSRRAKREHLKRFGGLAPEREGQNLALPVAYAHFMCQYARQRKTQQPLATEPLRAGENAITNNSFKGGLSRKFISGENHKDPMLGHA